MSSYLVTPMDFKSLMSMTVLILVKWSKLVTIQSHFCKYSLLLKRPRVAEGFKLSHPLLLVVASEETGISSPSSHSERDESQMENSMYSPRAVRFYSLRSHSYVHVLRFRSTVYMVRCSPRIVDVGLGSQNEVVLGRAEHGRLSSSSSGTLMARYAMDSSKQMASGLINLGDMSYRTLSKYCHELLPDGSSSPTSSNSSRKAGRTVAHSTENTCMLTRLVN